MSDCHPPPPAETIGMLRKRTMRLDALTGSQRLVLAALLDCADWRDWQAPVTRSDVVRSCQLSEATVKRALATAEEWGWLEKGGTRQHPLITIDPAAFGRKRLWVNVTRSNWVPFGELREKEKKKFVEHHQALIKAVASKWDMDADEAEGAALRGLVEAAQQYDPSKGVPFQAFARQVMSRTIEATYFPVELGYSRHTGRVIRTLRRLTDELGREPTDAELKSVGLSRAKVERATAVERARPVLIGGEG